MGEVLDLQIGDDGVYTIRDCSFAFRDVIFARPGVGGEAPSPEVLVLGGIQRLVVELDFESILEHIRGGCLILVKEEPFVVAAVQEIEGKPIQSSIIMAGQYPQALTHQQRRPPWSALLETGAVGRGRGGRWVRRVAISGKWERA